jgi:hypothetical protein
MAIKLIFLATYIVAIALAQNPDEITSLPGLKTHIDFKQ